MGFGLIQTHFSTRLWNVTLSVIGHSNWLEANRLLPEVVLKGHGEPRRASESPSSDAPIEKLNVLSSDVGHELSQQTNKMK